MLFPFLCIPTASLISSVITHSSLNTPPDLQRQMFAKPPDNGFFPGQTLCATLGLPPSSLHPVTLSGQIEEASEEMAEAVRAVTDGLSCIHSTYSESRKIPSKILHCPRIQGFPRKLGCWILGSPEIFFPLAETHVPATRESYSISSH